MNRKARDDRVERTDVWQMFVKVVHLDVNTGVAVKSSSGGVYHRRREINPDAFRVRAMQRQQGQKTSVPSAEVKYSSSLLCHERQEDALTFRTMRDVVRVGEVRQSVFRRCVFVVCQSLTIDTRK